MEKGDLDRSSYLRLNKVRLNIIASKKPFVNKHSLFIYYFGLQNVLST